MHNPPHPGEFIREFCVKCPSGITGAAALLGVSRPGLSCIINGRAGISPRMALRLEEVFGGTAESWLAMQSAHDLWKIRQTRGENQS